MIDSKQFRNTMGKFATGITIITTVENSKVHGMTANAFVSVSLDPPLVCVCIDHKAKMDELLSKTKRYGISILAEDQQQISQHFAGRPLEIAPSFIWEKDLPFIEHSIASMACMVVDKHIAGDHTLYIGEVKWLSNSDEGKPLIYYGGKYRLIS